MKEYATIAVNYNPGQSKIFAVIAKRKLLKNYFT